ncbi:MAG: magnesium transporter [Ignavibacteria bacterium]
MDVIEEEYSENVARMAGTDAEELEKEISFSDSSFVSMANSNFTDRAYLLFVVQAHDEILGKVILLAAFMPIISAISGNTGLQSAAIVVRGLDTGNININRWWEPLGRQFKTNLIIGSAVALIVGLTGYLLSDTESLKFAMSVAISMFISINIAGLIGTMSPMLSKRLGFDPAITSGPFETAFQDVIGISIFLTISTFLLTH